MFRCSWLKSVGLCVWNDLWLRLSVGVQVHAWEGGGFGKREWGWVFPLNFSAAASVGHSECIYPVFTQQVVILKYASSGVRQMPCRSCIASLVWQGRQSWKYSSSLAALPDCLGPSQCSLSIINEGFSECMRVCFLPLCIRQLTRSFFISSNHKMSG